MSRSDKLAGELPKGPRKGVSTVNGQMSQTHKVFAEHFAVHGDWTEAYMTAYPISRKWKSQSLHGAIHRLRQRAEVMLYIHELRLPIMQGLTLDYEWMVKETARQYYAASASDDRRNALRALQQLSRLLGFDFIEMARLRQSNYLPEGDAVITDAEYAELKQRVIREIGGDILARDGAPQAGGSQDLDADFRRLVGRVSDGATSPHDGGDLEQGDRS